MSPSSISNSEERGGAPEIRGAFTTPRYIQAGVVLSFILLLTARGVSDLGWPIARPELVGNERAKEAALVANARVSDGSLFRWWERQWRLPSPAACVSKPLYSEALLNLFKEADPSIMVGKDGFFFQPHRVRPRKSNLDELVAEDVRPLAALHRRLVALGIDVGIALLPRKSVICADKLPHGIDPVAGSYQSYRRAFEDLGMRVPDLLTPFMERRESGLYFPADTHWSPEGERIAAEFVTRGLGWQVPEAQRVGAPRNLDPIPAPADLRKLAGLRLLPHPTQHFDPYHQQTQFRFYAADGTYIHYLAYPGGPPASLMVTGTSYSDGRMFPQTVGWYCAEPVIPETRPGIGPILPIGLAMQHVRKGQVMPKRLLIELPEFWMCCQASTRKEISTVLMQCPTVDLQPIGPTANAGGEAVFRSPRVLGPGIHELTPEWKVETTRPGKIQNPGTGILSIRLRGEVLHGPVIARVSSISAFLDYELPVGAVDLAMPWVATRAECFGLLALSSPVTGAKIRIDSLELVMDLDLARAQLAGPLPLGSRESGWSQRVVFSAPVPAPRLGGLAVFLGPSEHSHPPGLELILELENGDRKRLVSQEALAAPAIWLVDTSALADQVIVGLEVRGPGSASAGLVSGAMIAPMKRL